MGALTNNPAIDGMQALSERAAATFQLTIDPSNEEPLVNPLLKAVLAALGLAENTTEEQAASPRSPPIPLTWPRCASSWASTTLLPAAPYSLHWAESQRQRPQ